MNISFFPENFASIYFFSFSGIPDLECFFDKLDTGLDRCFAVLYWSFTPSYLWKMDGDEEKTPVCFIHSDTHPKLKGSPCGLSPGYVTTDSSTQLNSQFKIPTSGSHRQCHTECLQWTAHQHLLKSSLSIQYPDSTEEGRLSRLRGKGSLINLNLI